MTLSMKLMDEGAPAVPAPTADRTSFIRLFESISEKLCLFVLLLGLSNIVGWIFDIQFLKSILPGASNMKVNAALGLILLSVSLLMLQPKRGETPALRLAARLCSSAAILIGSITLIEYITGWDSGFNQLFIKERPGAPFTAHPGQPSPLMALNLALAGLAIIGMDARGWRGIQPGHAALCVTGTTSLLTFIGHIYGVPHLLQFLPGSSAIAFNAALGMLALTFAILFARPASGVTAILISDTAGGVLARRMLFPSVVFMIALDCILNFGEKADLYNDASETAVHSTLLIAFFTGIIINTARRLEESDTRRTLAEKEMHQREARYRELFDNASDFVYTHDLAGAFTTVNKALCDGSGYRSDELIGASITKLVSPASIENARKMTEAKLDGATSSTNYEIEVIAKNGEIIPVEVHSRLIVENGKPVGVQGIGRHIGARKAAEDKLKAAKENAESATRLKDKFISLLSHDLRSPLASIILMQKVTTSSHKDAKCGECKTMLGKSIGICETMLEMTDNLLESARLQGGAIRLNRKICDIKGICETVMEDLNYLAAQKEVVLKNELSDGVRWYVDRILFQRVMHNLVVNALKFSAKGGVVTIFQPDGNNKQVAVKDTGTGIIKKLLPDIFKYEVKTTTTGTSGERGTGFGLPMCMEIVKAHGGTIAAASQMGKGSTFFIEVPDMKPLALVVDDDEVSTFILGKYLEHLGADVLIAANGAEALDIIHAKEPVLIITDLKMPVMDGFALLQKVKSESRYSHIPVIIITGSYADDIAMRQKAFECKADDFIVKPLSEADFMPRINRFIAV